MKGRSAENIGIKCPDCDKTYEDPRLLPCLHSLSLNCVKRLANEHPSRDTFACPLCQAETPKSGPGGDVSRFPSAFHLTRLLEVHQAKYFANEPGKKACGNCHERLPMDAFCFDCGAFLCSKCTGEHGDMADTGHHTTKKLCEFQNEDFEDLFARPMYCQHDREDLEEVEFYCKDCDKFICGLCNMAEAEVHTTADISAIVEAKMLSVEKESAKVKEKAVTLRSGMKNLSEKISDVDKRIDSIKKQMSTKVERMIKIVKDHEEEMSEQLEKIRREKIEELVGHKNTFEFLLSQTDGALEFTDPFLERNLPAEILSLEKHVSLRLRELGQLNINANVGHTACVEYVPNMETVRTLECCSFGHVAVSNTDPQSTSAEGEGVSKSYVGEETHFTLTTRDKFGNAYYSTIDRPTVKISKTDGTTISNEIRDNENGTYDVVYTPRVAGQYTVRIRVFNREIRQCPQSLSVRPQVLVPVKAHESRHGACAGLFTQPRGIAVSGSGEIAISDTRKHCVHILDPSGRGVMDIGGQGGGDGQLNYPGGVAFDKAQKHVVVADRDNHRVQIFSRKSGKVKKKFGLRGRNDGEFDGPSGVFVDQKGRIVVTDWNNHRVQVFSPEGRFLFVFGDEGAHRLKHPRDAVFHEKTQRFVVSDTGNNLLKVFDAQGEYVATIGQPGARKGELFSPRGLVVDADDRIIVCDLDNHRLQFFDFNGSCLNSFGSKGTALGQFSNPMGVAVLKEDQIIVSDWGNDRLQVFSVEPYSN